MTVAVLVGKDTRLLVQGLTGREGTFHARQAVQYGTSVVAGVTPGKSGSDVDGIPVFDTVQQAVEAVGVVALTTALDSFDLALGLDLRPLPAPRQPLSASSSSSSAARTAPTS